MNIDKGLIKHWAMLLESEEAKQNGMEQFTGMSDQDLYDIKTEDGSDIHRIMSKKPIPLRDFVVGLAKIMDDNDVKSLIDTIMNKKDGPVDDYLRNAMYIARTLQQTVRGDKVDYNDLIFLYNDDTSGVSFFIDNVVDVLDDKDMDKLIEYFRGWGHDGLDDILQIMKEMVQISMMLRK